MLITQGVSNVFDLMDMEDGARNRLLKLSAAKMADIARFCNQYPTIDLAYEVRYFIMLVSSFQSCMTFCHAVYICLFDVYSFTNSFTGREQAQFGCG